MKPVIIHSRRKNRIFFYTMAAVEPWHSRFWRATFCTVFNLTFIPFDLQGEYFRCPPPIILIFGYVIEDRKIRNTSFFIFPRFHIWGVKTAFKVRVEKSFLWNISRTIRDRGIVSMDEFCVFECEIWLTHQIFKKSIFSTKMIFQP